MNLITKTVVVLAAGTFLLSTGVGAQVVNETIIKSGKTEKKGFVALSTHGKTEVSAILKDQFAAEGLKKHGKKHKFTEYKGVVWHATGSNRVDLYYKVTGNKKHSKIYLIASKGYDNYITAVSDLSEAAGITAYLGGLDAAIARNEELQQKAGELNSLNQKLDNEKAAVKKTEDAKNRKATEVQKLQKTEAY